jgi:hypothetical protein
MAAATPTCTGAIYARQTDRRDGEPDRLNALVEGGSGGRQCRQLPISAPRW